MLIRKHYEWPDFYLKITIEKYFNNERDLIIKGDSNNLISVQYLFTNVHICILLLMHICK